MAVPTDPTDPANMSSDDRLAEVAAILAEGVRRLRRRAAISAAFVGSRPKRIWRFFAGWP